MIEDRLTSMIAGQLAIPQRSVQNTIELLNDGCTIPFIARYRKEATRSLDEISITEISKAWINLQDLIKRKEYILKTIDEQGKLSSEIAGKIRNCWDENKLEDLYLPFKKKRKTRAESARQKGLQALADIIWKQETRDIYHAARKFLNNDVETPEDALQGARDILSERINEEGHARDLIRKLYERTAVLTAKVNPKKKSEAIKYKDYFDYSEKANHAPSHRILAIFRAENDSLLKCKILIDEEEATFKLIKYIFKNKASRQCMHQIEMSIEDCLKRLMLPSLESEFRKLFKDRADAEAIKVFSSNLEQLLLSAPLGNKRVLGIDPGFRTGCKLVCIDETGSLLYNTTIYPHPPQNKWSESQKVLQELTEQYGIEAIAIGNGTAGKETHALLKTIDFKNNPGLFLVNEDGASIYSASEIAREEFPELDLTVRGAISIARRLVDPLSELVKIDPKSIGVGQYQHDVNQSKLKESLNQSVEHCVNAVGADLNTASEYLLRHISGLGPTLAKNIVEYRVENGSFRNIISLKKVPRMGAKAFEQCAGFLRVRNGENPLDNTGVHPERYKMVKQIAKDHSLTLEEIIAKDRIIESIDMDKYISEEVGAPTLSDIKRELSKPGFDIRGKAESFEFTPGIQSIDDLKAGQYVKGIINNITKFGAFVDIGIKEAGLVHVSQMADRFVKDPLEIVRLNQKIEAKVIDVDRTRGRISLSMKK